MSLLPPVTLALSLAASYSSTAFAPASATSSIQALARALKDTDPNVRIEAVNALAELGPAAAETVPALLDALDSNAKLTLESQDFQMAVARALTRIGKPAVPALVRTIGESEKWQVRSAAVRAIADMRRGAIDAVPGLVEILKGSGVKFTRAGGDAARALAGIGKPAVPELIELVKDSIPIETPNIFESHHRKMALHHAARALGQIGPDAVDAAPTLAAALKDVDEFDKLPVAGALCCVRRGDRAGLDALEAGLRHERAINRRMAAMLLGQVGQDAAPVVPTLTKLLSDTDKDVRTTAAEALGRIGRDGPSAVPALVRALEDDNTEVRQAAATALGECALKPEAAVPALTRVLRDKDATVRQAAAVALGEFGAEARAALPTLAEALRDKAETVSTSTAVTLGEIGTAAPAEVVAAVSKALRDPEPAIRRLAVYSLSQCGQAAAQALSGVLKDSDAETRQTAAFALGAMGEAGRSAVPTLVELAKGKDAMTRYSALEALATIGPAAGEPSVAVCRAALEDGEGMVRKAAADALGGIGPGAKEVLPQLLTATKDADQYVRIAAALALWKISGKFTEAKPVLQTSLTDTNRFLRLEAAWMLLYDNESAGPALSVLREALQDKDLEVRVKAVQMLAVPDGPTRDVLPLLRQALRDPDLLVPAIRALGANGPGAREAAPDLVAILGQPSVGHISVTFRRREILKALRMIDPALATKVVPR
jgi:HEAT repeat protein